ncbi:MAG: hypothetical protein Q9169_003721 [Polycauliona sp. 2 TL-2023]
MHFCTLLGAVFFYVAAVLTLPLTPRVTRDSSTAILNQPFADKRIVKNSLTERTETLHHDGTALGKRQENPSLTATTMTTFDTTGQSTTTTNYDTTGETNTTTGSTTGSTDTDRLTVVDVKTTSSRPSRAVLRNPVLNRLWGRATSPLRAVSKRQTTTTNDGTTVEATYTGGTPQEDQSAAAPGDALPCDGYYDDNFCNTLGSINRDNGGNAAAGSFSKNRGVLRMMGLGR